MNRLNNRVYSLIALLILFSASGFVQASHNRRSYDYARVVEARPIYQTVTHRIPVQKCRVETVRVEHRNEGATVVGGLLGAAIGHNLGHDKHHQGVRTVAGALIGASIAHSATRHNNHSEYRDVKRCHTHYDVERHREVVGYDVIYRYHGETFRTRTNSHPGDRIRVSVSVQAAH